MFERFARLLLVSIALIACGRTKPSTPATGAAGQQGTAGTTGAAGATGAAGTTGAAGATAANQCGEYCATMKSVCKGSSAQYTDEANCLQVCARLPTGTPADTTGNTVWCRTNALTEAAFETTPKKSCWAAGPLGFGVCGSECDIFCAVATTYCSAAEGYTGAPLFASVDDCLHECRAWKRQLDFSKLGAYGSTYSPGGTPETTDTLDCRASHLLVNAFKSVDAQQMHCPHAANKSEVCGPGNAAPAKLDGGTGDADASD